VSDPLQSDRSRDAPPQVVTGDTEEVDAVVVVSAGAAMPGTRQTRAIVPAVQAAAVAATGFAAGAAAAGLMRRRRQRRDLARGGSRRRIGVRGQRGGAAALGELVQIVGSRSLLVDIHLLGDSGASR
jgi:hypothetical protein